MRSPGPHGRASCATVDALVIPGGESTTMLKLLREEDLFEPLKEFGGSKPIFGTCAGAILLANEVAQSASQESLALMDIGVERNAYGRQLDSRIVKLEPANGRFDGSRHRSGVHPGADHPARRRGGQGAGEVSEAIRCWWSRGATWSRRSIRS